MRGWLAPIQTEHRFRVRLLLGLAGAATALVAARLLVLGLTTFAFLPLGVTFTVLGFLGICFGLALLAQGLMPWDTGSGSAPSDT